MQSYIPGTDVIASTTFVDSSGVALSPVAAEYRVLDEDGEVVIARIAVPGYVAGESEVSVTILAANNALDVGETYGMRVVEFYAQLETGWTVSEVSYRLALLDPLVVPTTSFQSYNEATLTATMVPELAGWAAGSKDERIAALSEARDRLCRLMYSDDVYDDIDWMSRVEVGSELDLSDLDANQFAALDSKFKTLLKKAQVVEANEIMTGNPVADKRDGGLMSETIGESSMMFRPGRPARYPVSPRVMTMLSRYLRNRRMIGRG
jgi:hypothetical protein